ncbi:MAG: HD domain-containing protein, partial [Candidatus Omnitrophica bacterium]|nr:HD domain-containing protein [Candidatus Omnitrophota bacterium]
HPQKAIDILEPLKFLAIERNMILNHHERYDGSGYPAGRKGNEICREALILAVADAFDAMNSSRAYRQALPREKIISELKNARNTQLSAEIVDIFLKLLEKRPELWEK